MKPFYKKGYALVLASAIMLNLSPTLTRAETRQSQYTETVYAGFIKEGERSVNFNKDWRFFKGNPSGAETTSFNDASWENLNLPHDWSIEGEFTTQGEAESGFLLGGTGWYRKHFVVPEKYEGKKLTLNFDGAYMNTEVYVNGKKIGENNYGYTAFAFDITDELIFDGQTENIISVKVTNQIPSSRWYSGSGIYRDVTLTVTESVHVSHLGTTVTTPKLESQKGSNVDVNLKTIVENESEVEQYTTVKSTIIDSNGVAVSVPVTSNKNIASGESLIFEQTAVVNNPKLWSVDEPNLYKVKNEVIVNGEVVDTYFTDFGFRYYKFDKNTGFSLNGEMMKLKGVCMHHDQGSLGAASYYRAVERQMEIMKEMGVNAIRVTHNPASEMLIEICNRLGLLVINEAFDTWTNPKNGNSNDFSKYFNQTIKADNEIIGATEGMTWGEFTTKAMVKNSKNAPSIIMWSISNEILEGISGNASNYPTIAQNIINWIKEEDSTRPVTTGDNQTKNGNSLSAAISDVIAKNGGIIGFNYTNESQFNTLRNNHPDWILYGAETSSAVHSRGYYKTVNRSAQSNAELQIPEYDNDSNRVGWGLSASNAWKYTIRNDYNAGEFVWTGFDYIGEPTPWNGTGTGSVSGQGAAPNSSYFGIVDTAGFEKDIYYLYQSQWNDEVNTLHVLPTWNREDIQITNGKVQVDVFTDAYKVELYLNGNKVGEQTSTEHVTAAGYKYYTFGNDALYPTFNVTYAEGTLSAKAYDKSGKEITNTQGRKSVTTSGASSTVKLSADKTTINSNEYDLSYITVDITDENGNFVSGANNRLNFTLEGNGKIVGVDNGNSADVDSYKPTTNKTATRKSFSGKALVIVQSTKDAGAMTLNVSGDGLESKSITINTVNSAGDNKYLESYEIVKEYYVELGEEPELPKTVVGRYSDGTTESFNIEWNNYDSELLNTPQVFKISGKLKGTDIAVIVNVHVIGNVVAMKNYSTFTYANTKPTLPNTVKGYLANGEESEDYKVTWDLSNADFSAANTIVTINGKVNLLGKEYPVISKVRVVSALETARNLAINKVSENDDIPKLSQSPTNTSDNLNSLNNDITSDGNNTLERWTNWNERNETVNGEPKGAYVQFDWKNKYDIDRLDLWLFTDNSFSRIPKKLEISYKNSDGEYVVVTHSNTTEVSYSSGETTYLLNEVVNTDSIRIFMQQPEVGKCIGLTEVKVYKYNPKVIPNATNTLSEIRINGELLEEFDPIKNEYTLNLEVLPNQVEATSEDNSSITLLPIFNNKSIIIVTAEDGSENIYTINYILPEVDDTNSDKEMLRMTIEYAEDAKLNGALENVVPAVVEEFEDALANAKDILSNKDATQEQIDESTKRLINVIHMLEFKKGDKSELIKLVEIIDTLEESPYVKSTWTMIQTELEVANKVIENENAMEKEVSDAYNKLIEAYLNLRLVPDKSKLEELINKADSIDVSNYTNESVNKLKLSLDNAKDVLNNEEAKEEEVEEVVKELELALSGLEEKKNDNGNEGGNTGNEGGDTGNSGGDTSNEDGDTGNSEGNTGNVGGNTGNEGGNIENNNENENTTPDSNNNNGTEINDSNAGNSSGNETDNTNNNLPTTGGTSSMAVVLFGTISSLVGVVMMKRKKNS